MMLKSVERLLEFVGDMNAIDGEWLDGWNRAVLATVEKIEKEVSERFMELPMDADGVPIRVGDVMEFSAFEIEKPVTRMVDGIGQGVFFAWCGERGYQQHEAKRYRHHHTPTVEDVLREFASAYDRIGGEDDEHQKYLNLIAEFAAKLRLAKEGE